MSQTGNPFLDALHTRQPDVDIVVLPPDGVPDLPLADPDDAAAAARTTAAVSDMLLEESGLGDPVTSPREVFLRWQRLRGDAHTHRTRTRVEHLDPPAAFESLLRVRDVLRDAGWAPEPIDAPTPWFVAKPPAGPHVDVAVEGARLVLTVTSVPLRLEEDPG